MSDIRGGNSASSETTALGIIPDLSSLHAVATTPHEQVLVRFTKGTGRFSHDKRYISLQMDLFLPNGQLDGFHQGVWEAQFSDPRELLYRPNQPEGPMNKPIGPVQHLRPSAETEAVWTFIDGSSIFAVGSAMSHLVPLEDGSALFMVACAQTITGGTGRYEGVCGLKTSLGTTFIPSGVNLFGPKTLAFAATTIDTFRLVQTTDALRSNSPGPSYRNH